MPVKPADRSLYGTRVPAAEHDIASGQIRAASPGYSPLFHNYIFPMNTATNWGPLWGLWFNSGGKSGEEPPQEIKDFMKIRDEALVALWVYFSTTGEVIIGLFSPEYIMAPFSLGKLIDLFKHLWIPAIIVGTAGTAGLIRTMRANLLDELDKPYVMVARAKGLAEMALLVKYPFRIALNPAISTIGRTLPRLVSGELLTSLVLGIPTIAPIFIGALMNQDMFLAGSIVLILSALTVIGSLLSDILPAWVDPRIGGSI